MPTVSSFIAFIHHLRMANEYSEDLKRSHPKSMAFKMMKDYSKKIEWILNDVLTTLAFPETIRKELRKEMNADILVMMSLIEKIHLIPVDKREQLELILDEIIKNENLVIEYQTTESN